MTPLLKDLQDQIVVVEPKREDFVILYKGDKQVKDHHKILKQSEPNKEGWSFTHWYDDDKYQQALSAYHKHFPTRDLEWKKDWNNLNKGDRIAIEWHGQIIVDDYTGRKGQIPHFEFQAAINEADKYYLASDYEPAASYESLNNCLGEGWKLRHSDSLYSRWDNDKLGVLLTLDEGYFRLKYFQLTKGDIAMWHESICKPEHINSIIKDIER